MDTYKGSIQDPGSLHKYLYTSGNPVNRIDPSGNDDMADLGMSMAMDTTLNSMSIVSLPSGPGGPAVQTLLNAFIPGRVWDAITNQSPSAVAAGFSFLGGNQFVSGGFGIDFLASPRNNNTAWFLSAALTRYAGAQEVGVSGWGGLVFFATESDDFEGPFINLGFPVKYLPPGVLTKVLGGAGTALAAAGMATQSSQKWIAGVLTGFGAAMNSYDPSLLTVNVFWGGGTTCGISVSFGGPTNNAMWQFGLTADIPLTDDVPL